MSDLIDREAAINFIKQYQCSGCSDIGLCGKCAVLIALKLLEKVPAAPRWVKCEDDKPKERDYYFAFTTDAEAFVGEYIPSVDQWWDGDDLILTVTHWMPIEPPREDVEVKGGTHDHR